jgi:hypothetical protein
MMVLAESTNGDENGVPAQQPVTESAVPETVIIPPPEIRSMRLIRIISVRTIAFALHSIKFGI